LLAIDNLEATRPVLWANKRALRGLIRRRLVSAHTILDVGCGIRPQTLVWPKLHICVEIHDEYVEYLRERCSRSAHYLMIHASWRDALRVMASKSVDTVFALDFIEHLSKEDGFDFLAQAERIARRQVVLFTPLGFFPQSYEHPNDKDRWGMHGTRWQTHRSGWTPEDFPIEWEIVACRDYHTDGPHGPIDKPRGSIWAIRTFAAERGVISPWEWQQWGRTMIHLHVPSWCRRILRAAASAVKVREQYLT
jgi:hypothetical protein